MARYWKLISAPRNFEPADAATENFIVASVKTNWTAGSPALFTTFDDVYCTMFGGRLDNQTGKCSVPGSCCPPSLATIAKVADYSEALATSTGAVWFASNIAATRLADYECNTTSAVLHPPLGAVLDWWPLGNSSGNATAALPQGYEFCDGTAVTTPDSPLLGVVKPDLRGMITIGAQTSNGLATDYQAVGNISTAVVSDHAHVDHGTPCLIEPGYNYVGYDIRTVAAQNIGECCYRCSADPNCAVWTYQPGTGCLLKSSSAGRTPSETDTSGSSSSILVTDPAGSHAHEIQLPATSVVKLMRVK